MTKANECTCPSGNGSLVHPCPAHPAQVEQAGDERAKFEAWRCQGGFKRPDDPGEWEAWQARAALAQPSPAQAEQHWPKLEKPVQVGAIRFHAGLSSRLVVEAAQRLYEFESTPEKEAERIERLQAFREQLDPLNLAPHAGAFNEAPAEALKPEPAEAERPEVVARVVHSNPVVLGQCGPLNANDELMTVAQHAASVARWAEMFNRVEQERDAALAEVERLTRDRDDCLKARLHYATQHGLSLARVAELTATRNRYGVDAHYFNKNLQRILRDFESFTPDELARSLIILAKVADEKVVAQAQHSVPDGYRLIRLEHFAAIKAQLDPKQVDAYRGRNIYDEDKVYANWNECRSALDEIKDVFQQIDWDAENELAELLAAAPGKSVPQAWLDVQAERRRQVEAEGWTPEHDDAHSYGQMARAAACYALAGSSAPNDGTAALLVSLAWPWDEQWWKPTSTRRDLVKACALALAEIERLDRAAAPGKEGA